MGYLENAACNGRRPKKVGPQRIYSRPRLVKRLVAERDVARFVVAPSGFGKTSLGLEYAASMFSFRGVQWLDCTSPCFLRDLDAGVIAETLISRPGQLNLVVFDDVPFLADARLGLFSHEVDLLLDAGCEVLVTTTPAFGAIADAQRDCVVVGARDLLVDDCELSSSHVAAAESLRECDRVPAFLWGGQDGMREFLRGMRLGEMPSEMRAPVFVMGTLQTGSFDDLSAISGGVRADARRFISEHYPYVGIDLADETFEAHGFEVAQVVEGLGESIDSFGRTMTSPARDALSTKVACMLASRGMGPRACEIMQIACARKRRISWILQQQYRVCHSAERGHHKAVFDVGLIEYVLQRRVTGQIVSQPQRLFRVSSGAELMLDTHHAAPQVGVYQSYPPTGLRQHPPQVEADEALTLVRRAAGDHDLFVLVSAKIEVDPQAVQCLSAGIGQRALVFDGQGFHFACFSLSACVFLPSRPVSPRLRALPSSGITASGITPKNFSISASVRTESS